MQCFSCSKWRLLRFSQLSFFKINVLGSSHFESCSPCCAPAAAAGGSTHSTVTSSRDFSSFYIFTVQLGRFIPLCQCRDLAPPSPTNILPHFYPLYIFSLSLHLPHPLLFLAVLLYLLLTFPSPDSLRLLQWNTKNFRAKSAKLLHFMLLHFVDFICV